MTRIHPLYKVGKTLNHMIYLLLASVTFYIAVSFLGILRALPHTYFKVSYYPILRQLVFTLKTIMGSILFPMGNLVILIFYIISTGRFSLKKKRYELMPLKKNNKGRAIHFLSSKFPPLCNFSLSIQWSYVFKATWVYYYIY